MYVTTIDLNIIVKSTVATFCRRDDRHLICKFVFWLSANGHCVVKYNAFMIIYAGLAFRPAEDILVYKLS